MEKTKKLVDFNFSKLGILVMYFLVAFGSVGTSFWLVISRSAGVFDFSITPYVIVLITIIATFFIFLFVRYSKELPFLFLVVAIPISLFFLLFMLPTEVPDEIWHIFRSLTVFQNNGSAMIIPSDANFNIPAKISFSYADFYNLLSSDTDWSNTYICDRDMSSYFSIHYIFSGIFISIGKVFGANYWICAYLGSAANMILYLVCGYVFLKYLPFGKTASFVFLLNPMLIQQEASCSADATTNICALIYVLLLFRNYSVLKTSKSQICLMLFFAILMCLCKRGAYVFMLLLMLVFLLKIRDKRKRIMSVVAAVLIGSFAYIYIVYIYDGTAIPEVRELMSHPRQLVLVLSNTLDRYAGMQFSWYFGSLLGSLNTPVPRRFWMLYLVLQIAVLFVPEKFIGNKFGIRERIIFTFVCLVEIFGIYMIHVTWSQSVDHVFDAILGVQGRYFIPVFIVLVLGFCRIKEVNSESSCSQINNIKLDSEQSNLTVTPKHIAIRDWVKENYLLVGITLVMYFVYYGDVLAVLNHFGM